MGNKINKKSDTFCILPWIHLHTWPNGDVYPCCIGPFWQKLGNLKDAKLEDYWNSDPMKDIRKKMLNGEKHNFCTKCYEQETKGVYSPRVSANDKFKHHIDKALETTDETGHNSDFNLKYWDFRFSNLCNMKCRICGSGCSSKWYEDEKLLYGINSNKSALTHVDDYSIEKLENYIDRFINDVEEVYFAGGEPLIMDEHYFILEKLITNNRTDVRLRYNTNLSILQYKKWNLIELWSKFAEKSYENVDIYASIDGIGKQAEYSRKGTDWNKILTNIKKCIELNIRFNISCTVSIFNVYEIPTIVDYFIKLGVEPNYIQLSNILTFPTHYKINILPENIKTDIVNRLDNHLNSMDQDTRNIFEHRYESIKNFLASDYSKDLSKDLKTLVEQTNKLDEIRQESFVEIFPYYKDWIENLNLQYENT